MRTSEKSLLFSNDYLRYIQKKTLNTFYCISLRVTRDVCFQKQKQMFGQSYYISW